jgi:hypothetical protein
MEHDDILREILRRIDSGRGFKSAAGTCKRWHRLLYQVGDPDDFVDALSTIFLLLPLHDWPRCYVSRVLRWETIYTRSDFPWDWSHLSINRNTTWDIVAAVGVDHWNWSNLSRNPNMTWEVITANTSLRGERVPWDFHSVASNPSIPWETIEANMAWPRAHGYNQWTIWDLSWRVPLELAIEHLDSPNATFSPDSGESTAVPWDRAVLISRATTEMVLAHPQFDTSWHWKYTLGKLLPIEYIRAHPELPYVWPDMHHNETVTLEFYLENKDKDWSNSIYACSWMPWEMIVASGSRAMLYISKNPNATLPRILENIDGLHGKPWVWETISSREDIPWSQIKQHLDLRNSAGSHVWQWRELSARADVTWETIRDHPQLPWSPAGVSANPNITWKIIRDNPWIPWVVHTLHL